MIDITSFSVNKITEITTDDIRDGCAYIETQGNYPGDTVFIGARYFDIAAVSLCGGYIITKDSTNTFRQVKMTVQVSAL